MRGTRRRHARIAAQVEDIPDDKVYSNIRIRADKADEVRGQMGRSPDAISTKRMKRGN